MGAGVCLWSPICVLRQLKLVGESGGGGGGRSGDSCGLGPRRGWAGRWEPGLLGGGGEPVTVIPKGDGD